MSAPPPVPEVASDQLGPGLVADLAALTPEVRAAIVLEGKQALWRLGDLSFKLDANQLEMHRIALGAPPRRTVAIECARKLGKSWLLWVIALETAIRNPGCRINYAAPTAKEATELSTPIVEQLTEDAPPELKPTWNTQTGHWTFPKDGPARGAYVVLFGCDDKNAANRGRGPQAVLNIIDEAGFIGILEYVVRSVLAPQTLRTRGRTIISSTPPETPDHDFCRMADAAKAAGLHIHRTIYQNGMMTPQETEEYIESEAANAGSSVEEFKQSSDFLREFLAERATDEKLAVVPDWNRKGPTGKKPAELCVLEVQRPAFFDAYESMDIGFRDPTAIVFGYWHAKLRALVIEDELLFVDPLAKNTQIYADGIRDKERSLWPTSMPPPRPDAEPGSSLRHGERIAHDAWEPLLRVADGGGLGRQVIEDMQAIHGLTFMGTSKDELDLMVDELRRGVRRRRVIINPRCVNLITQMQVTIWNRSRTEFERTKSGHGDLLMALVYLIRNVRTWSDPYPDDHGFDAATQEKSLRHQPPDVDTMEQTFRQAFPGAFHQWH